MDILCEELIAGLTNHDHLLRVFLRLFAAILRGGLIGLQRVSAGKPAGLRPHILVCLGTTVILLSCSSAALSPESNRSAQLARVFIETFRRVSR